MLCEDTRHTQGPARPARDRREALSAITSTTRPQRTAELLPRLRRGERMALVSDAGLPGVNDPGARLIAAALEAGVPVTVLPGPVGRRDGARRERARGRAIPVPRLPAARREGAGRAVGGARGAGRIPRWRSSRRSACRRRSGRSRPPLPERQVAVCRELTKRFEEVARGTAAELAERFSEPPKGEITLVVGLRARSDEVEPRRTGAALGAVVELVAAGVPRRQAADVVARLARVSRNTLYCRIVEKPLIHAASVVGSFLHLQRRRSPMRRILSLLVLLAALRWPPRRRTPGSGPRTGAVLRPFSLGPDPYAAGQHRGVDIGAAVGTPVLAPAAGTVSFVGSIPGGGRAVTIQTAGRLCGDAAAARIDERRRAAASSRRARSSAPSARAPMRSRPRRTSTSAFGSRPIRTVTSTRSACCPRACRRRGSAARPRAAAARRLAPTPVPATQPSQRPRPAAASRLLPRPAPRS